MSKSSEELAAILLSGYLSRSDIKNINGQSVAELLKEWTKAIDSSKNQDSK